MRNLLIASAAACCVMMTAVAAQQAEPPRKTVVRNPVFTAAQAERGSRVYDANCSSCHLPGLEGFSNPAAKVNGAPLTGGRFVGDFGEGKVSALFNKIKRDMPAGAGKAGSLTDQQYLDVSAFLLQQNKFPAGPAELTADTAGEVWIPGAGGAEGLADYTYVSGVGCLQRDPSGSWLLIKAQELKKTDPASPAVAVDGAPGEYSFRLLNAYNYGPEPHNGRMMRVSGYLVRLGAEIRVNVQTFQTIGTSCAN